LEGDAGIDVLWAAEGDDTLNGAAGMDVLFGGEGNDTLIGGSDADIFEFVSSTNTQTDTISYFSSDDKLKFYLASGQSELDQSNISNGNLVWNNLTIDLTGIDVASLDQLNIVYDYI
jgi:Ca2+-binding RTX toxin-like protein